MDIRGVGDIARLPFTEKKDLRDHYPFGMFAVPQSEIVRIHASSGTTGKPTVVGYTGGDIDRWAEMMARSMYCANIGKNDIVQVAYGYGLFTGGLGAHYGAERVGASVIPISGGNTTRQLMLIQDFGSTALCCTPSYALNLAEALQAEGVKHTKLKSGIFGAEPWTEAMRVKIEEMLGIDAINIYGLSEVMGPGVSVECMCKKGMHIWEDHFLPEIIGENGDSLPYGERGDLTFTTLTKHGMPLLRYRTHAGGAVGDKPIFTFEPFAQRALHHHQRAGLRITAKRVSSSVVLDSHWFFVRILSFSGNFAVWRHIHRTGFSPYTPP